MVSLPATLTRWFDSHARADRYEGGRGGVDWVRTLPYFGMHLACLGVFWVGWSPVAVAVATVMYGVRMLAITGFYHRYFSHRAFRTSRPVQFAFALIGAAAVQRGPIWWASHHRHHHAVAETEADPHSPRRQGFWRSHSGWFLTGEHFPVREERVRDWLAYPELRFLDRFDLLVPALTALAMYLLGAAVDRAAPGLGTSGPQMLVWGFFLSTVVLYHATFSINSMAHRWGRRRYATDDDSRNNLLLALLTFGEGWHNNHHHYPPAARQGFYWWEIDVTWYFLKLFESLGLIWNLRPVPASKIGAARAGRGAGT